MSDSKPIVIDKETWNQNEFLETICNRYFIIGVVVRSSKDAGAHP